MQAAGFNVTVYENRFFIGSPPSWQTLKPYEIIGIPSAGEAILNNFELGEVQLGDKWTYNGITLAVNYLEEIEDALFNIPPENYRSTFYVADPSGITTFATIPLARKVEFRQLLLSLKPAQTVGILFVNYI